MVNAGRIKICGLTHEDDVRVAAAAGADFAGFVLAETSPRYVDLDRLRALAATVPPGSGKVGVFVNATVATVVSAIEAGSLDVVQLHGDDPPETARAIGVQRVWKAFRLGTSEDVAAATAYPAAALLVDAGSDRQRGGTGQLSNWELAADLAARRPVMLAGGLNPGNVAAAIQRVRPLGVDVGSGVECCPGRKDHRAVRAFIAAARTAFEALA